MSIPILTLLVLVPLVGALVASLLAKSKPATFATPNAPCFLTGMG
jgi:hypothetical protein